MNEFTLNRELRSTYKEAKEELAEDNGTPLSCCKYIRKACLGNEWKFEIAIRIFEKHCKPWFPHGAYWWKRDDRDSRMAAFDKIIKLAEKNKLKIV